MSTRTNADGFGDQSVTADSPSMLRTRNQKPNEMNRARLTVGGVENEVVESHENMCHHCGFHAVPITHRCATCGIQCHAECGVEVCETCDAGTCYLCEQEDDISLPPTSTDRLAKRLVFHGLHWQPRTTDGPLTQDAFVAAELARDPTRLFHPSELPEGGREPMAVEVEGLGVMESVPMVVHSWCAASLFQVDPVADPHWRTTLLDRMFSCPSASFGTTESPVTRGGAPCQFCQGNAGWLTFCMHHLTSPAGCDRCRDRDDPTRSFHAFHPSCAVRHGMQRLTRRGRCGMFCSRHKQWRSRQELRHLRMWLGVPSGINHDLVNGSRLLPSNITEGTDGLRKGRVYT